MQDIWRRIETWLKDNAPPLLNILQPGADDAQIADLEKFLCISWPEDVKSSYQIHNGQSTYSYGLIDGRELLSIERIKQEWSIWKELLDRGTFQDENGYDRGSEPDIGIDNLWWSAKWIPLTYDGAGNHDCLDLSPAEGGSLGQIITMWHDDSERKIVAPSFRVWLKQYADDLEAGKLIFSEEYNGIININDI